MERGSLEELRGSIRQKEQGLIAQEEDYYRAKRRLAGSMRDLDDRHRRLADALGQEQEKMKRLLFHHDARPEAAAHFERKVRALQDESDWAYRKRLHALEEEMEQSRRRFYQERDQLEVELYDLRRQYHERTN